MNKLILPVIGIAAVLTAACGRDDNPPAETTPTPATQPASPSTTPPPATTTEQPQGTTSDQPNQ